MNGSYLTTSRRPGAGTRGEYVPNRRPRRRLRHGGKRGVRLDLLDNDLLRCLKLFDMLLDKGGEVLRQRFQLAKRFVVFLKRIPFVLRTEILGRLAVKRR